MRKDTEQRELRWINCGKALAILAVVFDHSFGLLYGNRILQRLSFYSVITFILLSGYTAYLSAQRHIDETMGHQILRRLKHILLPYAVATAVVQVYNDRFFDVQKYLSHLVHFDIWAPYYYLVILIQLTVVSPAIYLLIRYRIKLGKAKHLYTALLLLGSVGIGLISIRYTSVLPLHGGGRFIVGGTFFPVYVLGMLWADSKISISSLKSACFATAMSVLIWIGAYQFMTQLNLYYDILMFPFKIYDSDTIVQLISNPPGFTYIFYGVATTIFIYCIAMLMDYCKPGRVFLAIGNFIGRYSLYIYLYHGLGMAILMKVPIQNKFVRCFFVVIGSMLLIVCIKYVFDWCKRIVKNKLLT